MSKTRKYNVKQDLMSYGHSYLDDEIDLHDSAGIPDNQYTSERMRRSGDTKSRNNGDDND